jgi:hypothetical protein
VVNGQVVVVMVSTSFRGVSSPSPDISAVSVACKLNAYDCHSPIALS